MIFKLVNKQSDVPVDESFWGRAFNYAARELEIEHFAAGVGCIFIPFARTKTQPADVGGTYSCEYGAVFYVKAQQGDKRMAVLRTFGEPYASDGRMVRTFFHEMAHVKQLLQMELVTKPRSRIWKGQKWNKKEYSFAPWEVEAEEWEEKLYRSFLRREVKRQMQHPDANAYTVASALGYVFPQDDV
jgi:hypothetical protein